ncbi:MAG: oligoendopeptidase F [Eubacteriales bacterium]|nr:oligoendopeptidase F [Eubacteriales bacterium]
MTEYMRERNEIDREDTWDLSVLFASDEAWEEGLQTLEELVEAAAEFQGKLVNAESIRKYLETSGKMERILSSLFAYASMRRDEDTREEKAQAMYARIYSKYVQALTACSFAEPEILSLSDGELRKLESAPELAEYRYTITRLVRQKPHTLTASEEELLARMGEVFAVPREVATNLMNADLVFDPVKDGEGKETEVNAANYILLQMSRDRVLRENSYNSFYKGYRQHINTFAAAFAGAVKGAAAEAAARKYGSSREMSMSGEWIPVSVYDSLIESVRKAAPLMHRYIRLRKKILGVDELHYYDLYAPLSAGSSRSYSYEQAKQMVLDATAPLGEDYVNTVRRAYQERWIDVYPNKGKRGGAYSQSSYDSNPYILMNFTGTLDSVSTLAHEMGHSMHSWLSNHAQPVQYADYTIFVAEVASTVNENLLIEQLLKACRNAEAPDREEEMALLNQYLEGFKGTVYRQTLFAEFEREAHAMVERGEALHPASLNQLYKRLLTEYFGPDLVVDDNAASEWARIPHFYRPFYVYKYATSYSASVAISEGILQEGLPFVEKYLHFLSLGGSCDPLDELKTVGIDMTTPDPVDRALEKFGRVLDQAEALV